MSAVFISLDKTVVGASGELKTYDRWLSLSIISEL